MDEAAMSTTFSPPRVPAPIEFSWKGRVLTRQEVARVYLAGCSLLLALGVGLNYFLTDGHWFTGAASSSGTQYLSANPYDLVSGTVLGISLVALGAGFFRRVRDRHRIRAFGFALFGFYWGLQSMRLYAAEGGDFVNAIFAAFGVYFFGYFAYHELVSYQRDEDPRALAWLTGTAFITTSVYFITHKIEPISSWLILRVAEQTQWLLGAFGQPTVLCSDNLIFDGPTIVYPASPQLACATGYFPITIILACTAIQSIMIFVGGIFALKPPRRGEGISGKPNEFEKLRPTYGSRRLWAFLLTVPLIYVLNLFRNVIIIWMSGQEEAVLFSTPEAAFWFSHNVIGKFGSLVAMIIIAFIVFQILPELYDSIIGLLDLKERKGPLETWFGERWGRRGNGGPRGRTLPRPAAPPAPAPEPPAE